MLCMMASRTFQAQQQVFRYQSFCIDKNQPLGHGSFGAVYKAKCDQLPCAAKVLHPAILDPMDPGAKTIMDRFTQECSFLEGIRHPNIVQYLCVTMDPESRLPVLLMELLDESLTKMLERSQQPLPYYVQVDISHDIALAVDYLHSNDIIHRDLSSNNVLIIAGRRAKVTDFGMSKLAGAAPTMTRLTKCPGTQGYMAPEALRELPRYTKKLDCFSEGVIMIQVCTRLWPEPGPRTRLVPFPESPTGMIEVPVLETERRKNHIDLINPAHRLLPIATDCLKYHERERPSSEELCQRLAALKESRNYQDSVDEQRDEIQAKDNQLQQQRRLHQEQLRQLEVEKRELLTRHNEELASRERQLRHLNQQLQSNDDKFQQQRRIYQKAIILREGQLQQLNQQMEEQKQVTAEILRTNNLDLQRQVEQLQQQLSLQSPKNEEMASRERQLRHLNQQLQCKDDELQQQRRLHQEQLQQLQVEKQKVLTHHKEEMASIEGQLRHLNRQLEEQGQVTAEILQINNSLQRQVETLQMLSQQSLRDKPGSLKMTMKWRDGGEAPFETCRGAAVVDRNVAYFMDLSGKTCSYNSTSKEWSVLPTSPYQRSSLVVINGQLTAIGGQEGSFIYGTCICTDKLVSLNSDWLDVFPPMPTKRSGTTAVMSMEVLIVAGGTTGICYDCNLSTVEVMDTKTLVWSTVASLPHPYNSPSATICGDHLYMLGGWDHKDMSKSVLTCSLTELLQSTLSSSSSSVWYRVADIPAYLSTCVTVGGELVAVGGCDEKYKDDTAIRMYNTATNSWDLVSNMPTAQSGPLVVLIPTNEVMAVGGGIFLSSTYNVEIATFGFL